MSVAGVSAAIVGVAIVGVAIVGVAAASVATVSVAAASVAAASVAAACANSPAPLRLLNTHSSPAWEQRATVTDPRHDTPNRPYSPYQEGSPRAEGGTPLHYRYTAVTLP